MLEQGPAPSEDLRHTSYPIILNFLVVQIIGLRLRERENDLTMSTRLVAIELHECLVLLVQ